MWTINLFQRQHWFLVNTFKMILEDPQPVVIKLYAYTVSLVVLYVICPESTYFTLSGNHVIIYSLYRTKLTWSYGKTKWKFGEGENLLCIINYL